MPTEKIVKTLVTGVVTVGLLKAIQPHLEPDKKENKNRVGFRI